MIRAITWIVAALLLLPVVILVMTSFTELRFITFPPSGFTFRWYLDAMHRTEFVDSFRLSVEIATMAAVISTGLALLAALALREVNPSLRAVAFAAIMSPLVLPAVVIGIAMLQFFSAVGMPFSKTSLVIGHVIITMPYAVRLIADSLQGMPSNMEWAAEGLGATPWRVITAVILPLIKNGLVAGFIFTFIVSFENATISVFLAAPGQSTLPVRLFGYADLPIEPWLIAICSIVIVLTVALIGIIERVVGVQRVYGGGKG